MFVLGLTKKLLLLKNDLSNIKLKNILYTNLIVSYLVFKKLSECGCCFYKIDVTIYITLSNCQENSKL